MGKGCCRDGLQIATEGAAAGEVSALMANRSV